MVQNKPTFSEIQNKIEPIMCSGILIVHNALFDMSVLKCRLRDYRALFLTRFLKK